ncbi:hypothetical protein K0M31_011522, partial [Melipona bicolor]
MDLWYLAEILPCRRGCHVVSCFDTGDRAARGKPTRVFNPPISTASGLYRLCGESTRT